MASYASHSCLTSAHLYALILCPPPTYVSLTMPLGVCNHNSMLPFHVHVHIHVPWYDKFVMAMCNSSTLNFGFWRHITAHLTALLKFDSRALWICTSISEIIRTYSRCSWFSINECMYREFGGMFYLLVTSTKIGKTILIMEDWKSSCTQRLV